MKLTRKVTPQAKVVLEHLLKHGPITVPIAEAAYSMLRLGGRIYELRRALPSKYVIKTQHVSIGPKVVGQYTLYMVTARGTEIPFPGESK